MFRQLLARLVPKRPPFRMRVVQVAETDALAPPPDTVLGEVYQVHAAIHGRNKLLPVDALPARLSVHEQARSEADPNLL
jgi:hypothetical protein